MSLRNTAKSYGMVAKGFHWVIGLTVIGLICVGLYMVQLDPVPSTFKLYSLHKAIGITVLSLAVLRIIWRFINVQPEEMDTHQAWEKILAKIAHAFLYIAMIGMPLSGWVMSSAANYPVSVFGLFTLPNLVAPNESLVDLMKLVHKSLGYALIVAIGLHAAGALKHHVIDKDATLKRMLPWGRV